MLSIVNGYSGGELEQYIRATMIYLIAGQKELTKKRYDELKVTVD